MRRLLLIDDDEQLGAPLAAYFRRFQFDLQHATRPSEGLKRLRQGGFDVAILDVMLPEMDGFELCRTIRKDSQIPIVMLTARGDVMDRVVGLELGADDYLAKPFEPRELVARIRATLRRGQAAIAAAPAAEQRFDDWTFDRIRRQLRAADSTIVALSAAEFRLLAAFVDHAGRVLSRDRLLELTRVPGVEVNDRSIDLAVSRLRGKLGDSRREPPLIRTLRGEGYLFDAKVTS